MIINLFRDSRKTQLLEVLLARRSINIKISFLEGFSAQMEGTIFW